jgi:hypothetical protein
MVDDTHLSDLERVLPAEQFDILTPAMVPERLPLQASMTADTSYAYFDAGRERFAWLRDPAGMTGEVGDVFAPEGRSLIGEIHWSVLLRHRRTSWRVEKALTWSSLAAARLAAGMEWASRAGYMIGLHGDRWVVGPALEDFADPVRYLQLIREANRHKPRRQ